MTALSFECKVVRIPPSHKVTSNRTTALEIKSDWTDSNVVHVPHPH